MESAASFSNGRNFSVSLNPYGLDDRFNKLCDMYRWVKFNYIAFHVAVSAYTYSGQTVGTLNLQIDDRSKKVTGGLVMPGSYISPITGCEKFYLNWNLDGLFPENTTVEEFEKSEHCRVIDINSKKYTKFVYKFPSEC